MRDLARMAIAALARRDGGSGVIGVDVQRIRRALGLRAEPQPELPEDDPRREGLPREALRRFEALLRRELERAQVQRTGTLPPARPLGELDRALPSGPLQDLAAVHRVVAQLRRRLATQGHQTRGHRHHAHVDVRRTMRASLQTGGVPVVLKYRPRRPRRPEVYVLCDVSTSVTSASVFFLSVLHALHDSFRKMRSFVFIERISEVTDIFERERDFKAVNERISADAGVADISGYTDYGRVWSEFLELIGDDLNPRATVIVLGDARTNGRPPARRRLRRDRRPRRARLLVEPRAAAVLELRGLRDRRLRAPLHRVRVLDHRPARGLRARAGATGAGGGRGQVAAAPCSDRRRLDRRGGAGSRHRRAALRPSLRSPRGGSQLLKRVDRARRHARAANTPIGLLYAGRARLTQRITTVRTASRGPPSCRAGRTWPGPPFRIA